ncbi:hypothetical protein V1511DRAFT_491291 [Dipodascopsis uninucleata]
MQPSISVSNLGPLIGILGSNAFVGVTGTASLVLDGSAKDIIVKSVFHNQEEDYKRESEIKAYGSNTIYLIFRKYGFSLCFDANDSVNNNSEEVFDATSNNGQRGRQFVLDAIEFYAIDKNYSTVDAHLLPLDIKLDTPPDQLVATFGEPDGKGGGIKQSMDLWMRWDSLPLDMVQNLTTKKIGLEVQIDDRSWDTGSKSRWKSLTIFRS